MIVLITKEHLETIERTIGYECTAGIVAAPIGGGTILRAVVKNPKYRTQFNVQIEVQYEQNPQTFEYQFIHFAEAAKYKAEEEFGVKSIPIQDPTVQKFWNVLETQGMVKKTMKCSICNSKLFVYGNKIGTCMRPGCPNYIPSEPVPPAPFKAYKTQKRKKSND